jgi:hypothetical protein
MRGPIRQRLIQLGVASATSAVMLSAFVGLSAAAPSHGGGGPHGGGQGHAIVSAASHNQPSPSPHGNSANAPGHDADDTRPGWGCGDKNHVHSGPPGNPDAESPCEHHVVTTTKTTVSGTETLTVTVTETETGTETVTETVTATTTTATT